MSSWGIFLYFHDSIDPIFRQRKIQNFAFIVSHIAIHIRELVKCINAIGSYSEVSSLFSCDWSRTWTWNWKFCATRGKRPNIFVGWSDNKSVTFTQLMIAKNCLMPKGPAYASERRVPACKKKIFSCLLIDGSTCVKWVYENIFVETRDLTPITLRENANAVKKCEGKRWTL